MFVTKWKKLQRRRKIECPLYDDETINTAVTEAIKFDR